MRIDIKVVTGSSQEKIERRPDGSLKIWIFGKPIEGEANKQIVEAISRHLEVPKSRIRIVKGLKSREKTVELED